MSESFLPEKQLHLLTIIRIKIGSVNIDICPSHSDLKIDSASTIFLPKLLLANLYDCSVTIHMHFPTRVENSCLKGI